MLRDALFHQIISLKSTGIKTSIDTRFVGMAEGAKLNFSPKPVICFTFNKGIITSLIIIELFLIESNWRSRAQCLTY